LAARGLPGADLHPDQVRYLADLGTELPAGADPAGAEFLEVTFSWAVGGVPVFGEGPTDAAATIVFARGGKVVSLRFRFSDLPFAQFSEVGLLSFEEALRRLASEGEVVFLQPVGGGEGLSLSIINNLSFFAPERVRLVYFLPLGSDFLYPVYLFEGRGRVLAGNEVQAAVSVLAVSEEYLQKEDGL